MKDGPGCPSLDPESRRDESILAQLERCRIAPDPRLLAGGWQQRSAADGRMARDAAEAYREAGFEVRLEAIDTSSLPAECAGCKPLFGRFKMIYTRKKPVP